MSNRRSLLAHGIVAIAALVTVAALFVLPGAFSWTAYAEVYGTNTPVPPTSVPATSVPAPAPVVVDPSELTQPEEIVISLPDLSESETGSVLQITGEINPTSELTLQFATWAYVNDPENPAAVASGTPTGEEIVIAPAAILDAFVASTILNEEIRFLPAADRLLDTIDGEDYGVPGLRIEIYVLEGAAGGTQRYQLNIYLYDVLIDDRIELVVEADGTTVWSIRPV